MAVQAQLCSNLNQEWALMSGSSLFDIGDEKKPLFSFYDSPQDQGVNESQKIVNFGNGHHDLVSSSSYIRNSGMTGVHNLSSVLERQRLEMNCFLHFQNEKLKAFLNEETRKRELILMQTYESKMKAIINAKDEALNTATIKTKNLENYLQMAEKEFEYWEKKAFESEVMVIELNNELKFARARTYEDAESVCNDGEKEKEVKMVCKVCHVRSTCVLLLPCRHLCCCRHCEGLLVFCPVCETVKNGSLDVLFGVD